VPGVHPGEHPRRPRSVELGGRRPAGHPRAGRAQLGFEHQDIEPARELLVRILAVPHDQLFCVGDEDQTLYAFRRASVERIICLDMLYPALRRIALEIDYCCPATVVAACARLIAHNTVRFPKRIDAAPVVIQHRSSIVRSLTGW
jgi:ATP-dependent exoDNAse (exonuclease V) beta subunit